MIIEKNGSIKRSRTWTIEPTGRIIHTVIKIDDKVFDFDGMGPNYWWTTDPDNLHRRVTKV
jgi:hypothetical protein